MDWGLRFWFWVYSLQLWVWVLGFGFWVPGLGFGVLFYVFRIEGLRFFGIGLWV